MKVKYITNYIDRVIKMNKEDYKIAYENVMIANKILEEENQKLVKIIEELETWLKEKQDLTCGCGITREYIYAYENVLDKLTELKGDKDENN